MGELFSLLYRSKCILPARSEAELAMLDVARTRNQFESITGILHRESGAYFQWLEGPRSGVEAVYASIQADSRHTNVECLSSEPATHRRFSDWSMAYSNFDDESLFDWAAATGMSLLLPNPQEILRFLEHRASLLA